MPVEEVRAQERDTAEVFQLSVCIRIIMANSLYIYLSVFHTEIFAWEGGGGTHNPAT